MHVLRKGGNGSYKKNQWTSRNETFYEIKKNHWIELIED